MVGERLHSTIMLLVGYKNIFFSWSFWILDCSRHDPRYVSFRPNCSLHFCLRSCQKRVLLLHIRNNDRGRASRYVRQRLQERGLGPPCSVRGISGKTNTVGRAQPLGELGLLTLSPVSARARAGCVSEGLASSTETNLVTPLCGILILTVCCCSFTFFCNTE